MAQPGLITLQIPPAGERLDRAILRTLRLQSATLPRARVRRWFEAGRVFYQGRQVQASLALHPGPHAIEIQGWKDEDLSAPQAQASRQGSFLPILFENDELLILHKTSGVPSLPQDDDAPQTETAVGSALAHFPALSGIGQQPLEPGLLHRLDTGTSGCLAFAKNQAVFGELRALWKTKRVRKFYRAVSLGKSGATTPPATGSITTPIAASEKSAKRMISLTPGKNLSHRGNPLPAVTHLIRAQALSVAGLVDFELEIETGVRHQIRCHLASIGFPILGDSIYGSSPEPSTRLWLHAWRLELPLGVGRSILIEAKLPGDWPK